MLYSDSQTIHNVQCPHTSSNFAVSFLSDIILYLPSRSGRSTGASLPHWPTSYLGSFKVIAVAHFSIHEYICREVLLGPCSVHASDKRRDTVRRILGKVGHIRPGYRRGPKSTGIRCLCRYNQGKCREKKKRKTKRDPKRCTLAMACWVPR